MANEQYAFLEKTRVPDRAAWQAAIEECEFEFELDPQLTPFEDSGFLPCKLHGRDAGVEVFYQSLASMIEGQPAETAAHFRDLSGGRDYCIAFRWGGRMTEFASAMIAAYALAKHFGAVVSYEGEPPDDLESLLSETQSAVQEALSELG